MSCLWSREVILLAFKLTEWLFTRLESLSVFNTVLYVSRREGWKKRKILITNPSFFLGGGSAKLPQLQLESFDHNGCHLQTRRYFFRFGWLRTAPVLLQLTTVPYNSVVV